METLNPRAGAIQDLAKVDVTELVKLAAVDTMLFNQLFFSKTFRQKSPEFHRAMLRKAENSHNRFVNFMCFRGSAKTTLLRGFAAKRIAYAQSRTILYTSASQGHASRSLDWLRRQIETNQDYSQTFRLRPGKTWNKEALEIWHGVDQVPIWVIATGITGQNRGINLDDYRPDLIIVDDPCDEENTNTPEQRKKTADLFFGSLQNSLAPASESPEALMVLAQTILHPDDLVSMCCRDPQWASAVYSCFDESGQSTWPERFSTEVLLKDKAAYMNRRQLSLWMREMECKIVSDETSAFGPDWLNYYDVEMLPEGMITFMGIDPASSSSKRADWQVISVVGYKRGRFYLLEYSMAKGQNPEQTAVEYMRLADKWRPIYVAVETVGYQKTLKWYLDREQQRVGRFHVMKEINDRRVKQDRIRQTFISATKSASFCVRADQQEFITEFLDYPDVTHDDLLDSTSMALMVALEYVRQTGDYDGLELDDEDENVVQIANWRSAP